MNTDNNENVYLVEVKDESKELILDKLKTEMFATGKFFPDQRSVSPVVMTSLLAASGVTLTGASAAVSPKLFMATASSSELLMRHANGFLSAVIDPKTGKIIRQAAFLPVASSLPVVAPIMAMQVMSTVAVLHKLSVIDKKLDTIKQAIDEILIRQEATIVGELMFAIQTVDELYSQYKQIGKFSNDMLIRIALAERDAMRLSVRYSMLDDSQSSSFADTDTYLRVLTSFLYLRVKYLRTCVDLQENPEFVKDSTDSFVALLKENMRVWSKLLQKPADLQDEIKRAKNPTDNKLQQIAKKAATNKTIAQLEKEYVVALEIVNNIQTDFYRLIDDIQNIINSENTKKTLPNLLYWTDESGTHCFTTNQEVLAST